METKKQPQNKETKNNVESKALKPRLSSAEIKEMVLQSLKMTYDPGNFIEKMNTGLTPKNGSQVERDAAAALLSDNLAKLLYAWGLETHYPLIEANQENYHPLAMEASKQFIAEYDCKTSSEKALAEVVVNAYIEILTWTGRINKCYEADEFISDEKTRFLAVLSKELDRANRHFIAALETLKQIKNPPIEFNVKAKNAFVAQNQQINTGIKTDPQQYETIEPK